MKTIVVTTLQDLALWLQRTHHTVQHTIVTLHFLMYITCQLSKYRELVLARKYNGWSSECQKMHFFFDNTIKSFPRNVWRMWHWSWLQNNIKDGQPFIQFTLTNMCAPTPNKKQLHVCIQSHMHTSNLIYSANLFPQCLSTTQHSIKEAIIKQ